MDLNEENLRLGNERNELEIRINQLNSTIDHQK